MNVTDHNGGNLYVSMKQYHKPIRDIHQPCKGVHKNAGSVKELQLTVGNKNFIKTNEWLSEERVFFQTVFLILKNTSRWLIKIILSYTREHKIPSKVIFFFIGY